jgi:hypothetical protein
MARPTSTIKSGDLVCLLSQEEEEDCFLSVSASTEDKCSAKTIQDKGRYKIECNGYHQAVWHK